MEVTGQITNETTVNWYRTREVNHKEELAILDRRITAPVLFIQALRDAALPAHLGKGMTKTIPHLTYKQVNTSHWALWEKPKEVNEMIAWWLEEVVFTDPRMFKL
jgi:pimeloyl-ACP methyl ester carboxylesterase